MSDRVVELVALVGSLRAASVNRQLAQVAADNAPAGVHITVVDDLGSLPFYSEDIDVEGQVDASVTALREAVAKADGVLIATPEYNGTIPAALKNAIDWLSRPYGAGALGGKPVAVLSAGLGQYGGQWTREDTRKSVGVAGGRAIEEADLGLQIPALPEGGLTDPTIVEKVVASVTRLVDEVAVSA
ncbi:NAD(P)H-dependent oxidoreductase [Gordonia rubripertincta]|uniref:NAD(P)H-dependent oxidoreductase n=1 Tax=Gordonia rubripertincta TaxID=36822 RepID=UPI0011803944|nr:NADPH-dependent FMN reductase [Gordonia rubripertincta]TSD98336.1 NAD(P)H-dependent oxidoreductase [Gordonia rubripertincta]